MELTKSKLKKIIFEEYDKIYEVDLDTRADATAIVSKHGTPEQALKYIQETKEEAEKRLIEIEEIRKEIMGMMGEEQDDLQIGSKMDSPLEEVQIDTNEVMKDVEKAIVMIKQKASFLLQRVDTRPEKKQFLQAILKALDMVPADITTTAKSSIKQQKVDATQKAKAATAGAQKRTKAVTNMPASTLQERKNIRIKLGKK
jgi:hypothetical protein